MVYIWLVPGGTEANSMVRKWKRERECDVCQTPTPLPQPRRDAELVCALAKRMRYHGRPKNAVQRLWDSSAHQQSE